MKSEQNKLAYILPDNFHYVRLKAAIPDAVRRWVRRCRKYGNRLFIGQLLFGSLRRPRPVSRMFGVDRGLCIDRYYIENFLQAHRLDIRGRVLEVADANYTEKFGADRVIHSDVLHVEDNHPRVTIVADLAKGKGMPEQAYDCMIVTQTFQFIYDIKSAIATSYKALKPGGVLLATVPGISQVSHFDMERWGDYWRFTDLSLRRLLAEAFPAHSISVEAHGNVAVAVAFLQGLAAEELSRRVLDYRDPDYQLLLTVRAEKPGAD